MAVLQIIPSLEAGGAEISTLEMVEAVSVAGAKALVISEGGQMAAEAVRRGGELIQMPVASKNPLRIIANGLAISKLIRSRNIVLVHARSRAPAWSALLAARLAGIPFIATYHGAYGENNYFKRLYNSVMARGEKIIANSAFTAGLVRSRYGAGDEKLRIIPRGLDLEAYSPANISRARKQALLEKWNISPNDRIILHPARMTSLKGHVTVINAAAIMQKRGELDNVVIVMAGSRKGRGEYLKRLERQINDLGLDGKVLIVGHNQDMAAAYALARVTLIASTVAETFGRTSIEAQAMGCPVIVSNIGALPETIRSSPPHPEGERTGWLVEPGDESGLAAAMSGLMAMKDDEYDQLCQRAAAHARAGFSDHQMKVKTLSVYDEVLGSDLARRYEKHVSGG